MTEDHDIEVPGTEDGETISISWHLGNKPYYSAAAYFGVRLAGEYDPDGYQIYAGLKIEKREDVQRIVDHLTTWLDLTKE